MNPQNATEPPDYHGTLNGPAVRVNDEIIALSDATPTVRQILAATSLRPAAEYAVIRWPNVGATNEVGLDEVVDASPQTHMPTFFAVKTDGVRYFTLDEERYAWAGELDVDTVLRIGRVEEGMELWFERTEEEDRLLKPGEPINLGDSGVERIYTKKPAWRLQIQDKAYDFDQPQVLVRDALRRAGFDVSKAWEVKFKVKGEPIRAVTLDEMIDLTHPGVERLRVGPANVDNGEREAVGRRDFSLLPADAAFLARVGLRWQTVMDGSRWLIVEGYPLPAGYNASSCSIAIVMPESYPTGQLDMFFCHPPLISNGHVPAATEHRERIEGTEFQRWSRHRGAGSEWVAGVDSLETHFALVDLSLNREVGAR